MMFISLGIGTAIAVALIVVVSILTGGSVTSNNGPSTPALVGKTVKSFTLSGLGSGQVKAPWSSGHASVLIFFASDCGPCQSEMPKVAKYLRNHDESPLVVMGIDVLDGRTAARSFVRRDGVTFPVAFDANGNVTSGNFQFQGIPETVFLSKRGVVSQVYFGAIPVDQLAAGIRALKSTI